MKLSAIRATLAAFAPPIVKSPKTSIQRIRNARARDHNLKHYGVDFGTDTPIFVRTASSAKFYFEYGGGQSTVWFDQQVGAPGRTLETSSRWATQLREQLGETSTLSIDYFNLGETGAWGRPQTYEKRDNFSSYIDYPWNHVEKTPDVILIDGRFRLACFLRAFCVAAQRTTIIFDDYVPRPHYHVAEEFVAPSETGKRLAVFVIDPDSRDSNQKERAENELEKFSYVMD